MGEFIVWAEVVLVVGLYLALSLATFVEDDYREDLAVAKVPARASEKSTAPPMPPCKPPTSEFFGHKAPCHKPRVRVCGRCGAELVSKKLAVPKPPGPSDVGPK